MMGRQGGGDGHRPGRRNQMTTDTVIWGTVSIAGSLFVANVAALVYLSGICPLINCLN